MNAFARAAGHLTLVACLLQTTNVRADEVHDDARAHFTAGAELVKNARWSEALAAFERSFALVAHPVTLFNVGACERALGNYARARRTLERARALDREGARGSLSSEARGDIEAFLGEIAAILVKVDVHLEPREALIAVDGRPLEITTWGKVPTLTVGLAAPGPGRPAPAQDFHLELDPGPHVLVLSRPGYQDIVRRETFARDSPALSLVLARLEGTLDVRATTEGAAVAVNGVDVGIAPVTLRRPAGRYEVTLRKSGFVPFATTAALAPGGRVELSAPLVPESKSLTSRWWFWTGAAGVIALAAGATYVATRPEPERPAANGGGLGWVLRVP